MTTSILDQTAVVVPFRLASQRFPDKALVPYRGEPLLTHAVRNAAVLGPKQIIVTAPAEDLSVAAGKWSAGDVEVTLVESSITCRSATERVLEIFGKVAADHILTLPIDEPEIRPAEITRALSEIGESDGGEAITFYCDFYCEEDYLSPLSAKVVTDPDGRLLYMSRAVVPIRKDGTADRAALKKNVGAFLFGCGFLERLAGQADGVSHLDRFEGLEQLRWLELGFPVRLLKIAHIGFGIDVPEQLDQLEQRCAT